MSIPIDSGRDYVEWKFNFAMSTFYEVDTDLIQSILPSRLSPIEVVPGVSLINVSSFNFEEGGLGHLPEFQELIFSAIVSPDLSRGVPKFAMYVFSLGSTNQEHLDHAADYYKLPIHGKIPDVRLDKNKQTFDFGDSQGTIITMKNPLPVKRYQEEERYFQAFTSVDDTIYLGDLYVRLSLYEHQQSGNTGRLRKHQFFRNLDLEEDSPAFLQMVSEPGKTSQQFYFRPEKFD